MDLSSIGYMVLDAIFSPISSLDIKPTEVQKITVTGNIERSSSDAF